MLDFLCAPSRNTTLLDKDIAYTELQALHLLPYTKSVTFTEILSIQGRFFEFLFYAAKIQKILTQTTDIPNFTFRLRAGCSLPTRTFKFSVALDWFTSRGNHHLTTGNRATPTCRPLRFRVMPLRPSPNTGGYDCCAHTLRGTIRDKYGGWVVLGEKRIAKSIESAFHFSPDRVFAESSWFLIIDERRAAIEAARRNRTVTPCVSSCTPASVAAAVPPCLVQAVQGIRGCRPRRRNQQGRTAMFRSACPYIPTLRQGWLCRRKSLWACRGARRKCMRPTAPCVPLSACCG